MARQDASQQPPERMEPTPLPDVATAPHPTGPLLPHAPGSSPDTTTRQDIPSHNPETTLPEPVSEPKEED